MPAKTTIFRDPSGIIWRYCTGPCGRPLAIDNFRQTSRGYHNTWCKACAAINAAASRRNRWRTVESYRVRELRKQRKRYRENHAERERRLEAFRQRYASDADLRARRLAQYRKRMEDPEYAQAMRDYQRVYRARKRAERRAA